MRRQQVKKPGDWRTEIKHRLDQYVQDPQEMMQSLASDDIAFVNGTIEQLVRAAGGEFAHPQYMIFMLSVVRGLKPQNPLETVMAAQIAAVHFTLFRQF